MALTRLTQRMTDNVGELTLCSFSMLLSVPDGTGGTRPPTLGEIAALELTVTNRATGTVLNGLNGVLLLPDHGAYNATTGILVVNLDDLDNALETSTNDEETHRALIYLPGFLWVEILFVVQAAANVP